MSVNILDTILTYKEYLRAKPTNHLIQRYENFRIYMEEIFSMPVLIVGWQSPYKQKLVDKDQSIKDVVPRMVLTLSGIESDRSDITSLQATTEMDSYNQQGVLKPIGSHYVTVPYNTSFDMTIVLGNIEDAIRLSEFISIIAIKLPSCPGDEYSDSLIEMGVQSNIKNELEKKEYQLSNSVKLFVRLVEPTADTMNPDNVVPPLITYPGDGNDGDYPEYDDEYQEWINKYGVNIFHHVKINDEHVGTAKYKANYPPKES